MAEFNPNLQGFDSSGLPPRDFASAEILREIGGRRGFHTRQSVSPGFNRSEWDEFYAKCQSMDVDGAVRRAAGQYQQDVARDTPVLTSRLQRSILGETSEGGIHKYGDGDYSVYSETPYAVIVESRPPGGPAAGHGAMFAQNLARGIQHLTEQLRAEMRKVAR